MIQSRHWKDKHKYFFLITHFDIFNYSQIVSTWGYRQEKSFRRDFLKSF